MYRLQIYDQRNNLASTVVLSLDPITIGRDPSCELPLSDINISRKHARIEPMGRFYVVRDLKSTNGTWVNQTPVRMHLLKHGDVVRVGNYRLVVQVTGEAGRPEGEPDVDDCHTKIIEDPFSWDQSSSGHTVRIKVAKGNLPFLAEREARERLVRLQEISRKLGFIETPAVLCGQVAETVLEELSADRACFLQPDGDELRTVAVRVAEAEKGRPFDIHQGVVRSAMDDLNAILIEDAAQDQRFREKGAVHGVRAVMCVPLVAQTNVQGVIYVDRTTNEQPFTEDDLRFLTVIGNQVAINLANARLFEEVLLEKQKVQAVVSSLKDGLVITDQKLMVQSCNAAASWILFHDRSGYPEGKNLLDLLLAQDLSLEEGDLLATVRERRDFRLLVRVHEDVRAYAVSIAPISGDTAHSGYVFSFRDTTDLLHLQELKSEFIRNASHKLRTPLTVLMGNLDLFRSNHQEQMEENRTMLVAGMQKNLVQLQSLVTRFLEFAELDRTRIQLRPIDLRDVVAMAANGVASAATDKNIHIINEVAREEALTVMGDTDRLVQCLHNIVENSIKFAPEGSSVWVRAEEGEGHIRIRIEDEGPGIPQSDLLDIFAGFHQVEKLPTGEVPGAGLGLTIAKQIIHAHSGSISALSPVPDTGKGTVITISLPKTTPLQEDKKPVPETDSVR